MVRSIPAIVESDDERVIVEIIEACRALKVIEGQEEIVIRKASEHRLHVGRLLAAARDRWPERGPRAKRWGELLQRAGIAQPTAWRYMELAGYVNKSFGPNETPDRIPTYAEIGLDKPRAAAEGDAKPAGSPPRDVAPVLSLVPSPDAEPEAEIDRDTWCTPMWLTDPLGRFDLDPCSNERSQVQAAMTFVLDLGIDGLARGEDVNASWHVFINPPYSKVDPWIDAYRHTRFCFLLKLDTSTKWFAKLYSATALILIPRRRVNFIPPPGVPPEKAVAQQFPHALFYAHAEDATDAVRALCWSWRVDH
jgi:hypothetical protein